MGRSKCCIGEKDLEQQPPSSISSFIFVEVDSGTSSIQYCAVMCQRMSPLTLRNLLTLTYLFPLEEYKACTQSPPKSITHPSSDLRGLYFSQATCSLRLALSLSSLQLALLPPSLGAPRRYVALRTPNSKSRSDVDHVPCTLSRPRQLSPPSLLPLSSATVTPISVPPTSYVHPKGHF